jgi:hypothetical protein
MLEQMPDSLDRCHSHEAVVIGQKTLYFAKEWFYRTGAHVRSLLADDGEHESLHVVLARLQLMKQGRGMAIPIIRCDTTPELLGGVRRGGVGH